jgi:protocatechuate 3,4-dioxygenase beta subunit
MEDCHAFPKPLGVYDLQYAERTAPECRGRLRTDGEGKYGYRAIVPVSYAIPDDVSGNSSVVVYHSALVTVSRYCRAQYVGCLYPWDDTTSGRITYT